MKHVVLLTVAYAAMLVRTGALAPLLPESVAATALLALAVWIAISGRNASAIGLAAAVGLLHDCLTPGPLGLCMLLTTAVSLGLVVISAAAQRDPAMDVARFFLALLVTSAISGLLEHLFRGHAVEFSGLAVPVLLATCVWTLLFTVWLALLRFRVASTDGGQPAENGRSSREWLLSE